MKRADIVIVGDGIVGLTTALALTERGHQVLVVEGPASGERSPAEGFVSPVPPWRHPELVQRLIARSREMLPELVTALGQATGVDCGFQKHGLLLTGDQLGGGREWLEKSDLRWQWGPVAGFEPSLSGGEQPALLIEDISQIRSDRLERALALTLSQRGVPVLVGRAVSRLQVAGNIVLGVELADGRRVDADTVVLAAGAMTNPLLFDSGLQPIQIDPASAPWLMFNPASQLITHAINTGDCCLIPGADGRILASSLLEDEGQGADDDFLTRIANWLPALSRFDLESRWVGARPDPGRQLPAIGAYPQLRGLWINSGHLRSGLGIAPAAAELLAEEMNGGPIISELAVRLA
ncbi:MAG: NAD(P)/FAD-dependent oxidoreductase [Wenzhouxiangella sp.]